MKHLFAVFSVAFLLVSTSLFSQPRVNLKPFTRNAALSGANSAAVQELIDTIVKRFLLKANDTSTELNKTIQGEFTIAKSTDRLQSYTYPKKLKSSDLRVEFVDWSEENGITGRDSFWSARSLDAIIFIPVMYEDQHGESCMSLCFITELDIERTGKLDGKDVPRITLNITKMNFRGALVNGVEIK